MWRSRSAESAEVSAFAQQLAAHGVGEPAPFDASDGLSMHEAEIVALVFNPDLRLSRRRADVTAASAEHAVHWDDPVIGLDIERIVESVAEPWIIASTIGFTLPLSGRLGAAKSLAGAEHVVSLNQLALEEWQTIQRVRVAWVEWSALRLRAELTDAIVTQLDQISASTRRLVDVGEIDRTQAALFDLELARRRNESRLYAGQRREAEATLRGLMGLSPEAPLEFLPTVNIEPRSLSTSEIEALARELNPRLALRRAEYETAERTLALEVRKQYPDVTIGPGYKDEQGESRVLMGLSAPLPIFNANRQAIAEARAERELARAAFETEYERLVIDLTRLLARLEAARAIREDLEANIAPLADRQLDAARRLADAGELGELHMLVLLESVVRAHDTRLELVDARLRESEAAVAIEEIIGPPTSSTASPIQEPPATQPTNKPAPKSSEESS
ncbi:MAG: TolC family protein [Phycisphaerales bacterium]|nr:TolC family protein [Phycisphaerales bacterium]MCI0675070.1 TolC family protein [Phycisphaerales bacterium]